MCVSLSLSLLSTPSFAAPLPPAQCAIFSAIMETQIKWLDSSQLERGMLEDWDWDWGLGVVDRRAAYLVAGMTGSRSNQYRIVCGWPAWGMCVYGENVCLGINASMQ